MREVIVRFKAYKKMVEFLAQYSSNKIPRDDWVECMGFLFCNIEDDYYIVEDAYGVTFGMELDVQVSPMSLGNIDQITRDHEGEFIGGWWHTHPGLSPFFSETDIKNQVFYQASNMDGLGIVFDHSMIDKDFIGFQIFRLEHQFSDEYHEVEFQLQGFTKEGIKECMNLLKINDEITETLMEKYGGKGMALRIDFSKIGEPIIDDPLDDSEWLTMEAEDLLKEDKALEAIKKYKMASMILEGTEHVETLAEVLSTLIKLLTQNKYIENAREELELYKMLEGKIDKLKFSEFLKEILQLLP